ncbi:APA family basic amino acid/polyamine antiporter [Hydrogenoanaerobacterium saccharovorans]|uniref:Basic amino acid/polyamine antiporter, APA family n=1 Tax=Hydrogenoanaerobacterium saccharovorans TaxID=474960 RepID=A0A1H8DN48_9FIRM|nr:APC family permease [Hydrogenoanaerobacterium saccharovorans]RPF42267.1 APA family basic amino acid/polyamine antiporter [Hydrogenoanaerobacterium saccharovorans]SEN07968.1 basic amino acid/polyamine antiporter, APA family [Hydrogenoanaerobacterium saccharovorans]
MEQRKYGLPTAIAMIVGIVIGSGIFFKSDNILVFTQGNILSGVIALCVAAISIVFGCLALTELAARTDKAGGIISYAEVFCGERTACGFGWFHTFVYYPTLTVVVSWVAGVYINMLFGISNTLENQVLIGSLCLVLVFGWNVASAKLGGYFQNISTVIKLLPLLLFAVAGFALGNPTASFAQDLQTVRTASWIAAIAPVVFAFDGWMVSTSICHEIKNSKRNLPLAMIIAPILILIVYVLYFVGITSLVGADQELALGDAHVDAAAKMLLGPTGAKAVLVFVIISVLGTVNGLVMGTIRLPYSLSLRGMLPVSDKYNLVNPKTGIPMKSALLAFVLSSVWMFVHYVTQKFELLPNSDISEIAIVVNYVGAALLYLAVMRLAKKGEIKSKVRGYLLPALAMTGSAIILFAGMQNPLFWYDVILCLCVVALSQLYYAKRKIK